MAKKFIKGTELVKAGYANGISTQLDKGEGGKLTDKEKQKIIKKAASAYAKFLEALGCDWQNDPNS